MLWLAVYYAFASVVLGSVAYKSVMIFEKTSAQLMLVLAALSVVLSTVSLVFALLIAFRNRSVFNSQNYHVGTICRTKALYYGATIAITGWQFIALMTEFHTFVDGFMVIGDVALLGWSLWLTIMGDKEGSLLSVEYPTSR